MVITVVGVSVPLSSMTRLALRLHEEGARPLANRLGAEIDSGRSEIRLRADELSALLAAIERHPDEALEPLREALVRGGASRSGRRDTSA